MSSSAGVVSLLVVPTLSTVSTLLTSFGNVSIAVVFSLSGGILLPLMVVSSLGMVHDVLVVQFIVYSLTSAIAMLGLSSSLLASNSMSLVTVLLCTFLLIGLPLTIPNLLKLVVMGTTETNDFVVVGVAYAVVALLIVEIIGRVTQQSTGSNGTTPG